jgi:hypothetical protein
MVLIGAINVGLGLSSYHTPQEPTRIELGLDPVRAAGTILPGELPTIVVRAFVARYPHTIAASAILSGQSYVIEFPPNALHHHATFAVDGAFVSED